MLPYKSYYVNHMRDPHQWFKVFIFNNAHINEGSIIRFIKPTQKTHYSSLWGLYKEKNVKYYWVHGWPSDYVCNISHHLNINVDKFTLDEYKKIIYNKRFQNKMIDLLNN